MSTPVVMPQMGESIAEGTIVRWIKKVGDSVDRDEPLFEISTDKVDAEIPSPAAGTLLEIAVKEGETVPVNSVVATIGAAGEKAAPRRPVRSRCAAAAGAARLLPPTAPAPTETAAPAPSSPGRRLDRRRRPPSQHRPNLRASRPALPTTADRQKSSPLVRRIAKEHGVDLRQITGTGIAGRVTKQDILGYLEQRVARSRSAEAGSGTPSMRTAEL